MPPLTIDGLAHPTVVRQIQEVVRDTSRASTRLNTLVAQVQALPAPLTLAQISAALSATGSNPIITVGLPGTVTPATTGSGGSYTVGSLIVAATPTTLGVILPSATAGQVLQSAGAATSPKYSTTTYPATTTINQLLYSSAANTVSGLATANYGILNTNAGGVPSITASPVISTQVTIGVVGTATGILLLAGTTSGSMAVTVGAAVGGIFTITLPGGSTDFTATGGANKFLKQNSAGGAITVVTIAAADLSNGVTGTGAVVLADSPALTSVPTAPTAALGTNTTQIATTAFVIANAGGGGAAMDGVAARIAVHL